LNLFWDGGSTYFKSPYTPLIKGKRKIQLSEKPLWLENSGLFGLFGLFGLVELFG